MTFQHRELRADPGIAPGERNIDPPKRRSIWPSIAVVAAASAFGGVIWYAYHQSATAGGNGMPPLVRAEPGPTKVKPDNPGGQEIPFQDSTVYDRLTTNGGQKPVAEKLLPPPEEPATRTPPAPPPAVEATTVPPPPQEAQTVPPLPAPTQQAVAPLPPPVDVGAPTALAPAPGAIVIQPPPPPQPKVVQAAPPPKPAVVEAKKPEPAKPGANSIAALIAEAGPAAPSAPKAASGGGGYHLQLSAVRSADAVPSEWTRLKRRYPELAGLSSSTHKIDTPDKGTFYRVEAGPLDEAAAKSTCTRLRGEGLGCIVVKR
ncbi:MAG TPA: SPOR domain-containing protein [Alphaproteobacteria bacterium]|jgi:hypothetical protein|nr:SPOR domain-containing protein [Alphaproteobacteria bacterium]